MASRRAVPDSVRPGSAAVVRGTVFGLTTALVGATGALAIVAGRVARRVVTRSARIPDTLLVDVDTAAQTITLGRTPDTALPGRYGLFTSGTQDYLKVGTVLSSDAEQVTRKLLTQISSADELAAEAAFSGWYFTHPDELHVPYDDVVIDAPIGACPAWLFPADEASTTWAIHVHGRGTTKSESLRAVSVFRAAGLTSLLVSYRNDGDAPDSRRGTYGLGTTEWRDVDQALAYAREHGATRIVLLGWSMGGAIVLQLALNSAHRDLIVGVVLDSPVVDWRQVLTYQARLLGMPRPLTALALGALGRAWTGRLTGSDVAISFDDLDLVTRAAELRAPTLILHSDGDDFVPPDASRALRDARVDLVELEEFTGARHTKLWNYDEDRWTAAIRGWLGRQRLSSAADADS